VVPLSLIPLAANTISLAWSPVNRVAPSSYQTTHGTESFAPVKAMSGSTPLREGSTLRLGSWKPAPARGSPTCCQQKPPIAGTLPPTGTPAGFTPLQSVLPGPIGRTVKIWVLPLTGAVSVS